MMASRVFFLFSEYRSDSYRQFVLAPIIVVIDLWLFGHLFVPPAANQRFDFGRSTRTSRNSSGPLVSRHRRWARSSAGAEDGGVKPPRASKGKGHLSGVHLIVANAKVLEVSNRLQRSAFRPA
jgi:hypothetical protein